MSRMIDLTGQVFGRLTVIKLAPKSKAGNIKWECKCECGNVFYVHGSMLRRGGSNSCGCLSIEMTSERSTTHGMSREPLYRVWATMKARCYNKNHNRYKYYGGRGIKVCDRWLNSFENFLEDMGMRAEGLTIERVDNDDDYSPGNCEWRTHADQSRNRRTTKLSIKKIIKVKEMSGLGLATKEIASLFGVSTSTIRRVLAGKTWKGAGC